MPDASLKSKSAALRAKLVIEKEEADWPEQKRCREAEFDAQQK